MRRIKKINRQDGFTLLSMMLALSFLAIVLVLTSSVMLSINRHFKDPLNLRKEVNIFFAQTSVELHASDAVSCTDASKQLIFQKDGRDVSFSHDSKNRVVRKVNGAGYDIVLRRIADISFQCNGPFVSIRVTDTDNHRWFWIDRLYLGEEAGQ